MEYAIAVFLLGLTVTGLVAKGLFGAQEFLNEELQRQEENTKPKKRPD